MDIAASNALTAKSTTPPEKGNKTGNGTNVSADFETFLVMLTAQLENQDPLNPMDSSDYAVQLATFSGVEQAVLTNELLREMSGGAAGLADVAGWVGMEARSSAAFGQSGEPAMLHFTPEPGAASARIEVLDAAGREVGRIDATGRTSPLTWAGAAATNVPGAAQGFTARYIAIDEVGLQRSSPIQTYSAVTEVRQGADGPEIVLADGSVTAPDGITALRRPTP